MKRWARRHQSDSLDGPTPGFDFPAPTPKTIRRDTAYGSAPMICRQCQSWVPEGQLFCKVCAERRSREAFLEHQRQFMPLVFAGTLALRIRQGRAGGISQLHIELFGDPAHCYCGVPSGGMKQTSLVFRGELRAPTDTCAACAKIFEMLLNEELDALPIDEPEAS